MGRKKCSNLTHFSRCVLYLILLAVESSIVSRKLTKQDILVEFSRSLLMTWWIIHTHLELVNFYSFLLLSLIFFHWFVSCWLFFLLIILTERPTSWNYDEKYYCLLVAFPVRCVISFKPQMRSFAQPWRVKKFMICPFEGFFLFILHLIW